MNSHVDLLKMRTPLVSENRAPKALSRLHEPLLESAASTQSETEDGMWFFGPDMIADSRETATWFLVLASAVIGFGVWLVFYG